MPLGNCDRVGNGVSSSRVEDMLAKVLKWVESTDFGVKKIKVDLSNMSHLVDSNSTSIKQLEYQMWQSSASLNLRKNSTFSSETI